MSIIALNSTLASNGSLISGTYMNTATGQVLTIPARASDVTIITRLCQGNTTFHLILILVGLGLLILKAILTHYHNKAKDKESVKHLEPLKAMADDAFDITLGVLLLMLLATYILHFF